MYESIGPNVGVCETETTVTRYMTCMCPVCACWRVWVLCLGVVLLCVCACVVLLSRSCPARTARDDDSSCHRGVVLFPVVSLTVKKLIYYASNSARVCLWIIKTSSITSLEILDPAERRQKFKQNTKESTEIASRTKEVRFIEWSVFVNILVLVIIIYNSIYSSPSDYHV